MTFSNEDIEIFGEQVLKEFGYLTLKGFSAAQAELRTSAVLGDFLEIILPNEKANRALRFALLRQGTRDVLSVHIERLDKGIFLLDDYLKNIKESQKVIELCHLSSYHGTLSVRLAGCLNFISTMVNKYLQPVLEGDLWPSVPMDWGDYK